MDDSGIACDEIIEETVLANFNEKKANRKMQSFYILLAVLSVIIALLIAVSIYLLSYKISNRNE